MVCRIPSRAFLLFLAIFLPICAQGQGPTLQITLSYSDHSAFGAPVGTPNADARIHTTGTTTPVRGELAAMLIHVQLQDSFGQSLAEKSPDSTGRLVFDIDQIVSNARGVDPQTFRIRVYGPNIEETNLENIDPYRGDSMLDITLRRKGEPKRESAGASVALSRLQVPKNARKESDKGDESLQAQDLSGAERHFRKAIELYPDYDLAHNNLGVVLMQTGRQDEARQHFEKAVLANDKYARAYINLGKLDLIEKKYRDGDRELRKAVQADPLNAEALMLASETALFTGQLDDAIADAKLVHSMPHENFGLAHFFAGHAYEALKKYPEAIEEYNLFLKEAPGSPNVKSARDSIAKLNQLPAPPQ